MATLKDFMELFSGRLDAWGSVEGRSNKEPVTEEHYRRHFAGDTSLGIYMLKDGNVCPFFAVDIDKKEFALALNVRAAFKEIGIPVYIAESKSKGYHVYGFLQTPVEARFIRAVGLFLLEKLAIKAEFFPKQDALDDLIPLGNYINLPYFGKTRTFMTPDSSGTPEHLDFDTAFPQIIKVDPTLVKELAEKLKLVASQAKQSLPKSLLSPKGSRKKIDHPPCILNLLKGVGSGSRDVAAFALARHLLDQGLSEEEAVTALLSWNKQNRPPLAEGEITEKVKSAVKGYHFGCASILQDPLLSPLCVGLEVCQFIKREQDKLKKEGMLKEMSFFETETHLYEEIVSGPPSIPRPFNFLKNKAAFLVYEKATGKIDVVDKIELPSVTIVPIVGDEIYDALWLPSGVEDYGDERALAKEIQDFLYYWIDLTPMQYWQASWYIIGSWVFDKFNTIGYLRFLGDTGSGKSRGLDSIGRLCYKSVRTMGCITPAPIYRLLRKWGGSLVLDESDIKFGQSENSDEVLKILKCGMERGSPIIRCNKDDPNQLEILPCFGPKVFASEAPFSDVALESRCIRIPMEPTVRLPRVPKNLGAKFYTAEQKLRNKLLYFRLKNYDKIDTDFLEDPEADSDIDVEPRLMQIGLPFSAVFRQFPDVMTEFRKMMVESQSVLTDERSQSYKGAIVHAVFELARTEGREYVSSGAVAKYCKENFGLEKIDSRVVGKNFKSLNIVAINRRVAGAPRARYITWRDSIMHKLLRRYIDPEDREDYAGLFPVELPEVKEPEKIDLNV